MTLLRSAVLLVVVGALAVVGQASAANGGTAGSGCIAHHPNYVEDVRGVVCGRLLGSRRT
jgi:hypothetical protein